MYTEPVIKNFFTAIKNELTEFYYLDEEIWSPSANFDDRLANYIVKIDVNKKLETRNWIGFCFTLGNFVDSSTLGRPQELAIKDTMNLLGFKYDYIAKHITIQCAAFSGDPYYLLKFHEMYSVAFDRSFTFDVLYPDPIKQIGLVPTQVLLENSDLTPSYNRDTQGSLSKFGFNMSVDIPIVRVREQNKLIGRTQDPIDPSVYHAKILMNHNIPQSYLDNVQPEFVVLDPYP